MANVFTVTQIRTTGLSSIVDWSYGEGEKITCGCSSTNLSPIPAADRQDFDVVGPWLKNEIGSEFFVQKDKDLLADKGPPVE